MGGTEDTYIDTVINITAVVSGWSVNNIELLVLYFN